jgi:hypothetical protein
MNTLMLMAVLASGGSEWSKVDTVDGIELFARELPNERFHELKLIATVPFSPEALCDAAYGDSHIQTGEPDIVSRKLITEKRNGDDAERVTYERAAPPVVSARDFALRVKKESSGGACRLWFGAANELAPPMPAGVVRIEKLRGSWIFTPVEGGTRVTYTVFTDPGGDVPAMFIHGPLKGTAVNVVKYVLGRAQRNAAEVARRGN